MAVISQVKVGSSTYDIKDAHNGVEYIRGTWTAASGTWTGVSTDTELYDGKKIILFMPYAGSGNANATLNLTLADGTTTGAKNVYFESTNRFTTHKGQYSHIELIYHKAHQIGTTTYEGWWYLANRDTTVNYSLRNASNLYVTEAITANSIIVGDNNGYKKAQIGATFYLDYPILWCTQARTANTQNGAENYFVSNGRTVTTAYSSFTGGVAKSELYLVATVSGRVATIVSPFLTCTVPTSEDGKVYFPIGIMASTTVVDFCSIGSERFAYIDGEFQPVGGSSAISSDGLIIPTGGIWVQGGSEAGGDVARMTTTSGMPTELAYNQRKRGTRIYSNAIAFADPYNGNGNNDSGWIRHIEETANQSTLEIAVGDDNANEQVVVRRYNTSNEVAKEIALFDASGNSSFPGTLTASRVYNAVWNDYAEYRQMREIGNIPYGRVLAENGDDTISITATRMTPAPMLCSDTFGTCMGDETGIPIAVAGRVLAYPYEDRNEFKDHIGQPVCSGPKGTVSLMQLDEVINRPECIVGYVSAVPEYDTWGENNISVNGRVWIKVK